MRRNKIAELIKYFIKIKFEAEGINKNQKNSKMPIYQEISKSPKKIKYNDKNNKNINSVNKIEAKQNRKTKNSPKKQNIKLMIFSPKVSLKSFLLFSKIKAI